jgi:mannose-6-phosphate isomerase-like protein (cupin superfamily)
MVTTTQFPGGTAVSGLAVYDWETEDGLCGGSPHLHTVCTEGYVVVSGAGSLQTLTRAGFRETPLRAGSVVWFTPGSIHRAVNTDALRVLVVMQNAGLPEAGDAVLTFPPEIVADPQAYRAAASLAPGAGSHASGAAAARRRRDLAINGFLRLKRSAQAGDFAPLEEFYRQAVALVVDRVPAWRELVDSGPAAAVRRTEQQLEGLAAGRIDHLLDAELRAEQAPEPDDRPWGMCGRLDTYRIAT